MLVIRKVYNTKQQQFCFDFVFILFCFLLLGMITPPNTMFANASSNINLAGDSSISMVITNDTAALTSYPTENGAFSTTNGNNDVAFSVSTNNYSGYTLTVRSNSTTLSNGSSTIASLTSAVTAEQFADASSGLNNRWGFMPNIYNSSSNNLYYGPSTSAVTLDQTNTQNTVAKDYTISLGARINTSMPSGEYTNNLILETVANYVPTSNLTISYGTGVSSVTIGGESVQDGDIVELAQGVSYNIGMVADTDYAFDSWSATTGTIGSTSSQSTTYTIGNSDDTLVVNTTFTGTYIQNLSDSACTSTASTVYDSRDMHPYVVQRLADGNCWMMENLDLGRTTLTQNLNSENTNISDTITAETFNDWKKKSSTGAYDDGNFITVDGIDSVSGTAYGTLYNYYALSAGTISGSTNAVNAEQDICPAGWRLPTGSNNGEYATLTTYYSTAATLRASIANSGAAFSLAGYFGNSGSASGQGEIGRYWTSTRHNDTNMWAQGLDTSSIDMGGNNRAVGRSARCILKSYGTLIVTYGQGVSSVTVNGDSISNNGVLYIEKNKPVSINMTAASGYSFGSWSAVSGTIDSTNTQSTFYTLTSNSDTLTANASANSYTITLDDSNATTTGSSSATVTYNSSTVSAITNPSRSYTISGFSNSYNGASGATVSSTTSLTYNYSFDGWYTAASDGSRIINSAGALEHDTDYTDSNGNWTSASNQTLYSQWTNGTVTLPTITKNSYTCGWSTSNSTSTIQYASGATNFHPTANTTLYGVCNVNYMQNLPQSACTSTASTAIDNRDNRNYTIKRLLDGNCWMINNLNLGATSISTNLTSSNSNLATTVTASAFNSWKKTSGSATNNAGEFISLSGTDSTSGTAYGTLYNFYATTGGSITGNNITEDAKYDICPAGWRLPREVRSIGGEFSNLNSIYGSYANMRASIANGGAAFNLPGGFSNSTPYSTGTYGYFWASNYSNVSSHRMVAYITSSEFRANYLPGTNGKSIRCILDPTHYVTITYGTGIDAIYIGNNLIPDGSTIPVHESSTYTLLAIPSPNYVFSGWVTTAGTIDSTNSKVTSFQSAADATITANATLFNGASLQSAESTDCTSTASNIIDNRDGQVYKIQRLLDGNCWIMENLNLGATTINTDLTSSNTNLSTTITASTFNSWKKTTTTTTTATNTAGEFVHIDGSDSYSANAYGTLYNFYATSAGTISGDTNSNNAEHDICPAGWRLASVGELRNLYTYYNSNSAMRSSIANNGAAFVITGYFTPGSAINYNQSKTSYYWSSTVKSDTAMDGLTLNDTTVWTTSQTLPRNRHYPIRCVFKESETNPVTVLYDQGVTEVRIDNVVVADGDTIVLSGGTPHTISMTTTSDFLPGTFVVTSGVVNNNGGTTTYTTGTQAATLTANSIFNATYIQDIYTQECTSTATTVYDSRDLQAYRVKRLADGNCWMIDNLNLGAKPLKTHLTLQNTNINFSINSSVFNSWKKTAGTQNFTDGEIIPVEGTDSVSGNRYGTLYNYYAASAGTISGNTSSGDTEYDICPAGWRLPTNSELQTLYSNYNSVALLRSPIESGGAGFALPGYFLDSSPTGQGSNGYYWSSTVNQSNDTYMHRLNINTDSVNLNAVSRDRGFSIRCVLEETAIGDFTYMQEFLSPLKYAQRRSLLRSMSYTSTYNLIDNRDNKTYAVAKYKDNNIWMAQNLELGRTNISVNLTSANTNLSSAVSASTFNSWRRSNIYENSAPAYKILSGTDSISGTPYGLEYNYAAATAGIITGYENPNTTNTYDICPAGWKMPTGVDYSGVKVQYPSNISTPVVNGGAAFTITSEEGSGPMGATGMYWTGDAAGRTASTFWALADGNSSTGSCSYACYASIRCFIKMNIYYY